MKEQEFVRFLVGDNNIKSKKKAVSSRISRARKIEEELNVNLDDVVRNDEKMYQTLKKIKDELNEHNGNYQNSLRKYFYFVNKREFPSISQYERGYRLVRYLHNNQMDLVY